MLFTAFLFAGIGYSTSNQIAGIYPPWVRFQIPPPPIEMTAIAHVDIKSTLEDPTGDILFAGTSDNRIYSNVLFEDNWSQVTPIPDWENGYAQKCATEWVEYPTSWKDRPPIKGEILDSWGVSFERPLSTILRCYVLLENGDLQVWVHSANVFDLMIILSAKLLFTGIGGIAGLIISLLILKSQEP